jgi:lysophospholipase L1-like esterase
VSIFAARRRIRLAAIAGAAVLFAAVSTVTFHAHADEPNDGHLTYMALGDSFSSGHGADTEYVDNDCRATGKAYPTQFFNKYRASVQPSKGHTFANHACTGATTADLLSKQLPEVPADTDIVTLTIGGNDLHFADAARACTLSSGLDCSDRLNRLTAEKELIREPVANVLTQINAKAPNATVLLVGYPEIFDTGACGLLAIAEENRDKIRSLQVSMNTLLREVVTASGNAKNSFVDPDSLFETHRVCDDDRWINSVTDAIVEFDLSGSFHPNADGHVAIAEAVLAAANGGVGF